MKIQTTLVSNTSQVNVFNPQINCIASIYVCNNSDKDVKLTIWITTGTTPQTKDCIEYKTSLSARGVLERGGIPMSSTEKVFVQIDNSTVAVRACAVE